MTWWSSRLRGYWLLPDNEDAGERHLWHSGLRIVTNIPKGPDVSVPPQWMNQDLGVFINEVSVGRASILIEWCMFDLRTRRRVQNAYYQLAPRRTRRVQNSYYQLAPRRTMKDMCIELEIPPQTTSAVLTEILMLYKPDRMTIIAWYQNMYRTSWLKQHIYIFHY